ncbi:hypothetical protein [Streptomyces sp. NPDC048650]|uniref:hypothetical protein n=1 Tax=unclassified Streptomyces TaxID=2593676 RepID=UPI00371C7210
MAAPMIRTPHQATNDLRLRLDDALRRAGFDAEPSIVTSDVVEGVKINRVRIPALSLSQVIRLATILEAGSTADVSEKNRKKNQESSSGSDAGKYTGRKW